MAKRKIPKVNIYDAELMFEKYVEEFKNDSVTKKPIARALYYVWKWADFNEKERKINLLEGDLISRKALIDTMHLIMDDAVIGDNDEDYESLDDIKQQYIAIVRGMRAIREVNADEDSD